MYGKYDNLTVIQYEEARNNQIQGGYKYLIRSGGGSYTAFRTDKGFQNWLERSNVEIEFIQENNGKELGLGTVKIYKANGTIEEDSFWNMEQIPAEAKVFKGLSNGSLVDCFYIHTETGAKIFRPNPNAKEVYKPLPIEEHIEFQRVNG